MKHFVLSILWLISSFGTVFSQELDSTLVRLSKELNNATSDSIKIKTLIEIGSFQLNKDFIRAEDYFLKALEVAKRNTSDTYYLLEADTYVKLGVVNRRKANYSDAIASYLKAKAIYEKFKDASKIADVLHNTAMVYRYQKEHSKAISNFKQSIEIKRVAKDTFGLAAGFNMLGVSYRQNKQLDSAMICYQKAKSLFQLIGSKDDLYGVNGNIAVLYKSLKKYDKSLPIKLENLEYYKTTNNALSQCVAYFNISEDYKGLKDWKNSLAYADSSIVIAKNQNFKERLEKGYLRKSFAASKLGDYEQAYQSYRLFNRYSDSIFNINNTKEIQELELKYEFEKEKQEIEFLVKEEVAKKQLYLILFISMLIASLMIALLLRRNYKNKALLSKIKYENEKKRLKLEIESKENNVKQLVADNTMRLAFKKELLERIKNDSNIAEAHVLLQNLTTDLRLQVESETKLSELQDKINYVNKSFDDRLKKEFSELTKGEREVASLLRLNLSIKEIMTIRNVTEDSVKSMRRRIRKKMLIPQDRSIEDFIQSLV